MATPLILVLVTLARNPAAFEKIRLLLWFCSYAAFNLLFWFTAKRVERLSQAWLSVLLLAQIVPVLLMINAICSGSEGALLVVVAGLAPILSLPVSLSWAGAQTLLMGFCDSIPFLI